LTTKTPYKFQEDLAKKLIARRSLIVRAPTGAGKTWATVAPFLYSLSGGTPFADRLLYVLPLRSLASKPAR
jgi:CRISPR-associated endonuclease/helicase Cas3